MALGMAVGLGSGHILLDGDVAPPAQKGGTAPQFSSHFYCDKRAGCIKIPLGMEVGLGPGLIVLDGDPAPPPKKGHAPQFSTHVHCGQTAGWTKMPLGMKVCLGSGDFVLDGDPASSAPSKGAQQPHLFGPCLLWSRSPISATAELLLSDPTGCTGLE